MEISVRELKEHLSKYLRLVQAGEPVLITRHEKPVARLEPVHTVEAVDPADRLRSAQGVVWSGGKPRGSRVRLEPGARSASDMVLEDRR
jgi:prevent-host-death family protein